MKISQVAKNLRQYLSPVKELSSVGWQSKQDLTVYYFDDDFLDHKYVMELTQYQGYKVNYVRTPEPVKR